MSFVSCLFLSMPCQPETRSPSLCSSRMFESLASLDNLPYVVDIISSVHGILTLPYPSSIYASSSTPALTHPPPKPYTHNPNHIPSRDVTSSPSHILSNGQTPLPPIMLFFLFPSYPPSLTSQGGTPKALPPFHPIRDSRPRRPGMHSARTCC